MSGHSKWKNIMHKKEKTDSQRASVFTKIGKEIQIAVREGGPDPVSNSKLRDLIAKAKANNVPNDNIERSIKKAAGADGASYEEIYYEGYGPSGVAVIVKTATDNRNRTASDVRHFFDKYGGNLGQTGCVGYLFTDKGVIIVENEDGKIDEDKLMEDALEAGAEDFVSEDGAFEIYTVPSDLWAIKDALEANIDRASVPVYLIGVVVAAVSGYASIRLLRYVADKGRFGAFAYYCWAAGALTLLLTILH